MRADGLSGALERIYSVALNIDANTLSLQYFDTLKQLGSSPSTKFIFPMQFTNLLSPFIKMPGGARGEQGGKGQGQCQLRPGGSLRTGWRMPAWYLLAKRAPYEKPLMVSLSNHTRPVLTEPSARPSTGSG